MNRKKILIIVFVAVIAVIASVLIAGKVADKHSDSSSHSFTLLVVDIDGNTTSHEIKTSDDIVGTALINMGIIEGEQGPYGMYIKLVDGIEADYDKDGTYWAFYIGDEYAQSGVDTTPIVDGTIYSLKVEKY